MNAVAKQLREELSAMDQGFPAEHHPQVLEALRKKYNHAISIALSRHPIERYICAVYAFDLVPSTDGEDIKFFDGSDPDSLYEMFISYAETRGFKFN